MNPEQDTTPRPTSRAAGWHFPAGGLLLLEGPGGLVALDASGQELGRFAGAAADELRALCAAPAAPSPLLRTLLRQAPGLEGLLAGATPLSARGLLGQERGWGQLFVELTARCNERCVHCYASAGPGRTERLERATVEAVVHEAGAMGFQVVQFTGGEALLCPFLPEVVRLAREVGIPTVEVYTNGLLLDAARFAALADAAPSYAFSLYAADPAVHDAVTRVEGSHGLTVGAIRRALEGGADVRVGVVVTRSEDEGEGRAAVRLARALGVPRERVRLQASHAVGRGVAWTDEAPALGGEDLQPEGGDHASAEGGKAAVLPDGWVTPCIFSRDLRLGRVGPEGGLRAALEDPALQLSSGGVAEVAARLSASCSQLTCAECRLTTCLLG